MYWIAWLLYQLSDIYTFIIFAYIIMTWFPMKGYGLVYDIFTALGKLCNPYLNLFKKIIPPVGMVDFSPVVAVLVLQFGVRLIVSILI